MPFEHSSKDDSAKTKADKIVDVAADELSPVRDPMFASSYHRDMPPPMKTSIDEEMAKLNQDPKEMRRVLDAMTGNKEKYTDVNITRDAKGEPTSVTFEIPGTEHFMGRAHRYDILNEHDEKNARTMAKMLKNTPEPMTYQELRTMANTVRSYQGNETGLDRMMTNMSLELNPRGSQNYQRGFSYSYQEGKLDAVNVFGRSSITSFHLDGRITRDK